MKKLWSLLSETASSLVRPLAFGLYSRIQQSSVADSPPVCLLFIRPSGGCLPMLTDSQLSLFTCMYENSLRKSRNWLSLLNRSLSTGKSQPAAPHIHDRREVSAEKGIINSMKIKPGSRSHHQAGKFLLVRAVGSLSEPKLIPPLVYFITLLRVFEQHSKRWLVNYAYCILILNFIWFAFPLPLIHAQTSRGSFSAEEELRFFSLQEAAIAPKPLNLSN